MSSHQSVYSAPLKVDLEGTSGGNAEFVALVGSLDRWLVRWLVGWGPGLQAEKHMKAHPLEKHLDECMAEWKMYIKMMKALLLGTATAQIPRPLGILKIPGLSFWAPFDI